MSTATVAKTEIPAAAALTQRLMGYWDLMVIRTAVVLSIPDLIHAGYTSPASLASSQGWHEPSLRRFLRAMMTSGLLRPVGDHDDYALTDQGSCLRSDAPDTIRNMALMVLTDDQGESWMVLPNAIRTGQSAFVLRHGMPVFELYKQRPEIGARFATVMRQFSVQQMPGLLAAYDFSTCGEIADIGGGEGHVLAAILQHHPEIKGILFDLPQTAELARQSFAAKGLSDRVRVESGDMFQAVPAADTYFLKWILHDWNDAECVQILRRLRQSVRPGGRVLIADMELPSDRSPSPGHYMDMNMLAQTSGQERSRAEVHRLFRETGFTPGRTVCFDPGMQMSIFEALA